MSIKDRIAARLAEVKELREDNWFCDNPNCSDVNREIDKLLTLCTRQADMMERMRGALEFYANAHSKTYHSGPYECPANEALAAFAEFVGSE